MSNVIASIALSPQCNRRDIPRVLASVDYFDQVGFSMLQRLVFRAKLIDINYQMTLTIKTKRNSRSPAHCLIQRLRLLESRAKKASSLFWKEIVKEEIARRPRYYSIEAITADRALLEKSLAAAEKLRTPTVQVEELEDWLKKHSPFINKDLDKTIEFRRLCLERQKRIEAMSPSERKTYLVNCFKNDPICAAAFAAEGEREMLNMMRGV